MEEKELRNSKDRLSCGVATKLKGCCMHDILESHAITTELPLLIYATTMHNFLEILEDGSSHFPKKD